MLYIRYNILNSINLSYNQINNIIDVKLVLLYYNKKINLYRYLPNQIIVKNRTFKSSLLYIIKLYNCIKCGYFVELLLIGLGYRVARIAKNKLCFELNYSHKIVYVIPRNIIIRCFKKKLIIFGINKALVINTAHKLRFLRSPNIYKGTGIRFLTQDIKLKIGKQK